MMLVVEYRPIPNNDKLRAVTVDTATLPTNTLTAIGMVLIQTASYPEGWQCSSRRIRLQRLPCESR